jgi:hypothetical protein
MLMSIPAHSKVINAIVMLADGSALASASSDGKIE